MITIYGLTDEHGQIRYVGQTVNPSVRFRTHVSSGHNFKVAGFAILDRVSDKDGSKTERHWIEYFGVDNLSNGNKGPNVKLYRKTSNTVSSRLNVRLTKEIRGKLMEEAGQHGTISNVVRAIVEKYFSKKAGR